MQIYQAQCPNCQVLQGDIWGTIGRCTGATGGWYSPLARAHHQARVTSQSGLSYWEQMA
jgi:hypothetical protein